MQDRFDPYYKWLGIPPDEQPPNHYRLLGLRTFEADHDVIESAAEAKLLLLRARQTGPNAAVSQRLLNEVTAAQLCLLNPAARSAYNASLKQQAGEQMISPPRAAQASGNAARPLGVQLGSPGRPQQNAPPPLPMHRPPGDERPLPPSAPGPVSFDAFPPVVKTDVRKPRPARGQVRWNIPLLVAAGVGLAVIFFIATAGVVAVWITSTPREEETSPPVIAEIPAADNPQPEEQLPPPGDYALEFDGNDDYVEIPSLKYDGGHPITIEAWVSASRMQSSWYTLVVDNLHEGLPAGLALQQRSRDGVGATRYNSWGAWVSLETSRDDGVQSVLSPPAAPFTLDKWTHLALQLDGDRAQLYIDGVVVEDRRLPFSPRASTQAFAIGKRFAGRVKEVRISRIDRYGGDFTPVERFPNDNYTLALYHFDAGRGDQLFDASGHRHHGQIQGALWYAPGP